MHAAKFKRELREPFEAYWSGFAQQIRATRNEAGHPASVDPVFPDTVHSALLIFPERARLAGSLTRWAQNEIKIFRGPSVRHGKSHRLRAGQHKGAARRPQGFNKSRM
jgi:hypothetical protein